MVNNYIVDVELPSKECSPVGYPKKVKISTLTVGSMKKYAMINDKNSAQILKSILSDVVKDQFDVGKLYNDDFMFLLVWERINSFAQSDRYYPIDFTCPDCKNVGTTNFDLETLEVKNLSGYKEPMEVKLLNGDVVAQKLLTLDDEIELDELVAKESIKSENRETLAVAKTLVSLNGVTFKDLMAKVSYMNGLRDLNDFHVLSDFSDYFTFGYVMKTTVKCLQCKEGKGQHIVDLPFREDFLIPPFRITRNYRDAITTK